MLRSLRARILVGFGSLALTLLIVSAVAMASLSQLSDAVATILRENYASVIACEDMLEALERQDSAALFASTGHRDIAAPMLRDNRAAFEEAYAREAHNITVPGEGARVREIERRYREYLAAVDRALVAPSADALYFRVLLPQFTALKGEIRDVLRINQASMEAADGRAKAIARQSVRIVFIVSLLALLTAAWFARRVAASIVRPVASLAAVARAIGEGHLEHPVDAPTVTELAPLAEAFDKMLVQLREYRASSLGELLAAKDLANATVECMVDPVVVFGAAGEVLLTNEAAQRAFGLEIGSAEDLRAHDVSVPTEFALARDRVLSTGQPVVPRSFSEAMRRAAPEGERFYLVRAAPLRAEGASKPRAIILAQDVTRFRRIDELKSDMVATVSHEFKTPLTSLRMATHMLLEDSMGPLTASQREVVTTARDDTERLRAMVDELLDLVRIEAEAGALRRTPIDPWKLLQTVADAHRVIAHEKNVELALEAHETVEPTSVDPEKLSIVLANLCSNAIRHSPPGAKVRLGTSTDETTLRFVVRDAGEGIPADELPRLFERTPNRRGGFGPRDQHGLGLTIAREIVLQHGGELTVQSAPGEGSVFTVALPRK